MEAVGLNPAFWQGRRVLITGHTGFKGAWLSLWLQQMGAKLTGLSLEPSTEPNLFTLADVGAGMTNHIDDIRDAATVAKVLGDAEPEVVFHLAAQALVRDSYKEPVATYASNVMGTVHVLEAVRHTPSVRAVVNITSDKCYENREWLWGYRENEALGGYDPYSSSKAAAELVTAAYRQSFFQSKVQLASARAGNVIGGGDWAKDRLLPDLVRAFANKETVTIRFPDAVRPWQHVFEPLAGYLQLAEALHAGTGCAEAWNFGPYEEDTRPVAWLVEEAARLWGNGAAWQTTDEPQPHEAGLLVLDATKARSRLGWRPRWRVGEALEKTVTWYRHYHDGDDMRRSSLEQLNEYMNGEPR